MIGSETKAGKVIIILQYVTCQVSLEIALPTL